MEEVTEHPWEVSVVPALPATAQASVKTVMTGPHQLPAVLKVGTDASTAATSAANAIPRATTRSLNDPRSEM
jgi:hypothetical protein